MQGFITELAAWDDLGPVWWWYASPQVTSNPEMKSASECFKWVTFHTRTRRKGVKPILAVRMEISSYQTTVGSEARKHCYLCWKIWFASTEGEPAVFVLSCKNHPLLPQNKHWCMLYTHISQSGGLPEVNRLDKKHKVKTGTVRGASHLWTFLVV